MPTAKKTDSGKYKVRVYSHTTEDGKKHYKAFTADTKREAERLAATYKLDNNVETMTFSQRAEHYLRIKSVVLSPATIRSYKVMLNRLNKDYPKFCHKVRINQADVQELINDLSKELSPKSVRNYNALVSVILGDSSHFKVTLPQCIKPTYFVPNKDEIKRLFEDVKDKEIEVPILLGSFCMMRRSEICALKMSDIKGNMIHIHSSVVRDDKGNYVEKTTKTVSSDRTIQAPDFVIEKINKKGYITNMSPAAISDAFHRIVIRLGFNGMRFHDLRHWGASYRHSTLNIPTAHIQQDGGWSNAQTLENIYRHALSDDHLKYSQEINTAFSEMYSV